MMEKQLTEKELFTLLLDEIITAAHESEHDMLVVGTVALNDEDHLFTVTVTDDKEVQDIMTNPQFEILSVYDLNVIREYLEKVANETELQ